MKTLKRIWKWLFDLNQWSFPEYAQMRRLLLQAEEWHELGDKEMEGELITLLWRKVVDYRKSLEPVKEKKPEKEIEIPPSTMETDQP